MLHNIVRVCTAGALIFSISGCQLSNTADSSSGSGSNSTEFKINGNDFTIVTHANNVGPTASAYSVQQVIEYNNQKKFYKTINYSGTLTTECIQGSYSYGEYEYSCTSSYNTSSPIGDPSPETWTIKLKPGINYDVKQIEYSLDGDKSTTVGTFSIN